jgi:hypothetical protein
MSLRSRKASSFSLVAYHHADFCLPDGYVRPHLLIKPPGAKRPQIPFCYRDGGRVTFVGRVVFRFGTRRAATSRPSPQDRVGRHWLQTGRLEATLIEDAVVAKLPDGAQAWIARLRVGGV